jgi:parvulin-like peptidyl-prolyl isomerase
MAKQPKKHQEVELTKKQVSHSRREQRTRMRVVIGIAAASVIILGVILAGILSEFVFKPNSAIAIVNGEKVTTAQYQKLVRYQRNNYTDYLRDLETQKAGIDPKDQTMSFMIQYYEQMIQQAQEQLATLDQSVLEQMIQDRLIRQGAAQEGIAVAAAAVDAKIEQIFGYQRNPPTPTATSTPAPATGTPAPTMTPEPTPTPMTKEAFDKAYAQYLTNLKQISGMDEADYRDLVTAQIYRDELQKVIDARVPATGEQVWARHILVADEATAQTVEQRLAIGEDFAALAKEFSTDTSNKDAGGDLGWFGRGQMVAEFEKAAFALAVGQISQPISTTFGYHIIKAEGHEANRELDASTLQQLQTEAFNQWLTDAQSKADIQRYWSADKVPPTATPVFIPQQ